MSAGIPFWRKHTFWFGLAVLGPVAAWYVAMSFWPILRAFWISLQFFNPLNPELTKFAGLDQYRDAFTSPRFQRALVNTWQYMLTKNAVAVPVGLLLALLLDRVRSRQAYLFAYFLPGVMSVVGIAVLFRWLYDPTVGPLDGLLRSVGLPAPRIGFVSLGPTLLIRADHASNRPGNCSGSLKAGRGDRAGDRSRTKGCVVCLAPVRSLTLMDRSLDIQGQGLLALACVATSAT